MKTVDNISYARPLGYPETLKQNGQNRVRKGRKGKFLAKTPLHSYNKSRAVAGTRGQAKLVTKTGHNYFI